MEVGERALPRVLCQVLGEPGLLRAAFDTRDPRAVRVERDQVPRTDVVAVPALPGLVGRRSEVVEVPARVLAAVRATRVLILVVARNGPGHVLDRGRAPRRVVGLVERGGAPTFVLDVAERQDGAESTGFEHVAGVPLAAFRRRSFAVVEVRVRGVARDVAGGSDDGSRARGRDVAGDDRGVTIRARAANHSAVPTRSPSSDPASELRSRSAWATHDTDGCRASSPRSRRKARYGGCGGRRSSAVGPVRRSPRAPAIGAPTVRTVETSGTSAVHASDALGVRRRPHPSPSTGDRPGVDLDRWGESEREHLAVAAPRPSRRRGRGGRAPLPLVAGLSAEHAVRVREALPRVPLLEGGDRTGLRNLRRRAGRRARGAPSVDGPDLGPPGSAVPRPNRSHRPADPAIPGTSATPSATPSERCRECACIVDTSKLPSYCFLLSGASASGSRFVHLVRDSRAVAFSFQRKRAKPDIHWLDASMKRFSPLNSAVDWNGLNLGMELIAATSADVVRVRYEDLVADPGAASGRSPGYRGTAQ